MDVLYISFTANVFSPIKIFATRVATRLHVVGAPGFCHACHELLLIVSDRKAGRITPFHAMDPY